MTDYPMIEKAIEEADAQALREQQARNAGQFLGVYRTFAYSNMIAERIEKGKSNGA